MIVQFEVREESLIKMLENLKGLGVLKVRVLEEKPIPRLPSAESEFEDRALKIASKIAPRPSQDARRDAIKLVLGGGDTFTFQRGENDPAIRNATGALSKALRPFAPYVESPLEILAQREREVFGSEGGKGTYKGTRYRPTKLGRRVLQILTDKGQI